MLYLRRTSARALLGSTLAVGLVLVAGGCSLLTELQGLSGTALVEGGSVTPGADGAPDVGPEGATDASADAAVPDSGPPRPCVPSGTVESTTASPSTAVDDARVGTIAWSNPSNVTAKDGAVARTPLVSGLVSTHWLLASGFGVALPPRAIVRGFVVQVTRFASFFDEFEDEGVALVKAGDPGASKSLPAPWSSSPTTASYGGPSDLWGTTWTEDQVNAADFGVAVAARGIPASDERASVDSIQVTVHFERCTE